jgi:hypothetical protein
MKIFNYAPVYVKINESYGIDKAMFTKSFEKDAAWLADNDIDYQVSGFRWPEMLSMLVSRDILIEFTITIEDDTQAVMFRLYSGLSNDA